MPYKYYQEWGLVDSSFGLVHMLIIVILVCASMGLSEVLLNRQRRFRAHLVVIACVALFLVLPGYVWDMPAWWVNGDLILVFCIWDHCWARHRWGQSPMSLKKVQSIQLAVVVILAVCGVLSLLGMGFFQYLPWWTLLVSACYVGLESYLRGNDTNDKKQ